VQPDGKLQLSVSDNGVGLTTEVRFENASTLGLELVTILAEQLDGKLTIQRANPTRFSIIFPIDDE
jgi:two-component sensor histidine kinase